MQSLIINPKKNAFPNQKVYIYIRLLSRGLVSLTLPFKIFPYTENCLNLQLDYCSLYPFY